MFIHVIYIDVLDFVILYYVEEQEIPINIILILKNILVTGKICDISCLNREPDKDPSIKSRSKQYTNQASLMETYM